MHAWGIWVLWSGVIAGVLCLLAGVVPALVAARRVSKGMKVLKTSRFVVESAELQRQFTRISGDLASVDALLVRAHLAVEQIKDGFSAMRIPEAMLALRTAGTAIRLLRSGR